MTHQSVEVQKADFQPDVDFEVAGASAAAQCAGVVGDCGTRTCLSPARTPFADVGDADKAAAPDAGTSVTVLFDTSASRALGYGSQVDVLANLVSELRKRGQRFPASRRRLRSRDREIFAGKAADFGPATFSACAIGEHWALRISSARCASWLRWGPAVVALSACC